MAEAGGTTTQSGIYYQNSIAALYLGRLIDSSRLDIQVIESVRVESPDAVDDTVITYADSSKEYIQAKERLSTSSTEWKKLWSSFKKQSNISQNRGDKFSLLLVVSNTDTNIQTLRELCDRANGKENVDEWLESLNSPQLSIVEKIKQPEILTDDESVFSLLKFVSVNIMPLDNIEKDYIPNYTPNSNIEKKTLYSVLRDKIGGYSRVRRSFKCSQLLEELLSQHKVEVEDSPSWGISAYKEAIEREFHILSVPATDLRGDIDKLFLWPELHENSSSDYQDFEFEDLRRWSEIKPKSFYELKDFPRGEISQAVINSGAGLGKTTLLKAITYKLSQDKIKLPVFISLSSLLESSSVISYLNTKLNDEYHVRIDWGYLCLSGRVSIFFDGLDELSNSERQDVLDKIIKHVSRFPETDFLLTVRDSSILTQNLDVKTLEIRRLSDEKIIEFSEAYSQFGSKIDGEKLLEHTNHNNELMHLLRIPLFLSLVLATFNPKNNLPTSRTDILEQYLDILFSPEHKPNQGEDNTPYLREVAELLAYQGLVQEHIGFNEKEILRYLRDLDYCDNPKEYLESLHKFGILSKISSRWQFTYPTIQEYLASQYILESKQEEISNSFEKIILRPWAQTMQFVLESYPNSNEIIKEQIKKDDDAFYTSLRLISRCVVNGANVDIDTKKEIGDLLATYWNNDSSVITESIGNLLLDGFINDLPLKAEEHIVNGWALYYGCGGAKILTAKKDKDLTRKALINLLSKNIEHKFHLNDWQDAVNEIAEEALTLYLQRSMNEDTTEEEVSALRSLITNLNESKIGQEKWVEVAKNNKIPSIIRLVIAIRVPKLVEIELNQLYEEIKDEWLNYGEDYYINSYEFERVFWQMPECEFFNLIKKNELSDEQIIELLNSLFLLKLENNFLDELLKLYNSDYLSNNIKFKLNLLLSSKEMFMDQNYAVEQLDSQDIENITLWCFLIGHIEKEVALKGLEQLTKRNFSKEEYIDILSSLSTGLNYKMEPTITGGGVLDNVFSHSALTEFSNWLLELFSIYDFTNIEYVRASDDISRISFEKVNVNIEDLLNEISSTWVPLPENEYDEEDRNIEWAIQEGLRLSEREKIQLSEDCLLRIVSIKRHNLVHSALPLIVKIANMNTVDKLIEIYKIMPRSDMKGYVVDALEKISNRLGIRVIKVGDDLKVE